MSVISHPLSLPSWQLTIEDFSVGIGWYNADKLLDDEVEKVNYSSLSISRLIIDLRRHQSSGHFGGYSVGHTVALHASAFGAPPLAPIEFMHWLPKKIKKVLSFELR